MRNSKKHPITRDAGEMQLVSYSEIHQEKFPCSSTPEMQVMRMKMRMGVNTKLVGDTSYGQSNILSKGRMVSSKG